MKFVPGREADARLHAGAVRQARPAEPHQSGVQEVLQLTLRPRRATGRPGAARFRFWGGARASYCRSAHLLDAVCGVRRDAGEPVLLPRAPPCGILKKNKRREGGMSRALSVYHGHFGRATLYELNRPMTTHAHREGHLIFYLDGATATAPVSGVLRGLTDALRRRGQPVGAARLHPRRPRQRAGCSSFSISTGAGSSAWADSAHAVLRLRPLRDRDDAAHPRHGARSRVAARRLRYRGQFRRHAVRADRCLLRAILAACRRLAALFAARHRPSSTSGCANRSC